MIPRDVMLPFALFVDLPGVRCMLVSVVGSCYLRCGLLSENRQVLGSKRHAAVSRTGRLQKNR